MPLRLLTAGESHGPRLTAILEGLPAGLTIDPAFVARELARRQHGYGRGGRMKIEKDEALFEGGVRGGRTLGSPIAIGILNRDFANWEGVMGPLALDTAAANDKRVTRPRPGHADLAGGMKYGSADLRDVLERASARESAARVAAGAVCKLLLSACGIEVRSGVLSLGPVVDDRSPRAFSSLEKRPRGLAAARGRLVARAEDGGGHRRREEGRRHPRRLDPRRRRAASRRASGASRPGTRRLDGRIGQALLSVPAVKAVEFGSAIEAARGPGSRAHDEIERGRGGALRRRTNRAGGLEAGVSNGEDVVAVAHMKPISTLARGLDSVDLATGEASRSAYERSDVTAVPACGVICEAMLAFVLADALLALTGGDRLEDVTARLALHRERVRRYPRGG